MEQEVPVRMSPRNHNVAPFGSTFGREIVSAQQKALALHFIGAAVCDDRPLTTI